jgi:hypothetical protein
MSNSEEFPVPDFTMEVAKAERTMNACKEILPDIKTEGIPYFAEILRRELEAVLDNLTVVDHYHAASRCARAALELTMKNMYFAKYPKGRLLAMSFSNKYFVPNLTSKESSPLLRLVRDGSISEFQFQEFREKYKILSDYVHHRTTYDLFHTLSRLFPTEVDYAQVVKTVAGKNQEARIVKATLLKFELNPALELLFDLLRATQAYL